MAVTIAALEYGNRTESEFIAQTIISAGIQEHFSLFDGVKDKQQIPVFAGSLTWGTDLCVFDPQSVVSIDEKEFVTKNYKWAFKNCKTALQRSYRSLMLKQGQNNQETMDSDFKDWVFDYFSKLASKHIGTLAHTEITTQIAADANVNKTTGAAGSAALLVAPATVLAELQEVFKLMTEEMYLSNFNVNGVSTDQSIGLAFVLPYEVYQAAHIALTNNMTFNERAQIEAGDLPLKYMGIPIYLDVNQIATRVVLAPLDNFVTVVDDIADVKAIQTKYIEELSSDYFWGQFTIGFGYKKSELIVEYTAVA
jgi:hypothetical protein|tara:strand:- start:1814 stop:2740 length:927 start_codon:yes stop_codon:yes gene_type:complete